MSADELRDPKVKKQIAANRKDAEAGHVRDVREFIAELRAERTREKKACVTCPLRSASDAC